MTTTAPERTLAKFANAKRGNYCTLPVVDVEILDEPRLCAADDCDRELTYQKDRYGIPSPVHVDGTTGHFVRARTRCSYCGTQDPAEVTFVQASWSDETRCTRCGGVSGYAIGD